jgi:hypothetical protein
MKSTTYVQEVSNLRGLVNAQSVQTALGLLENSILAQLAKKNVIPNLGFYVYAEVKAELRQRDVAHRDRLKSNKGELLNRKMEAFNLAFNSLVSNPLDSEGRSILSNADRESICSTVITLCAPSRINEPLCMSIDDHITVEDYAAKQIGQKDTLHRSHQMLLMKGSKGAQWSAKPVLSFMMDALDYCLDIVREQGKRSRMLVEWYQRHPTALYLPPELEHLRGKSLSILQLAQIIYLTPDPPRNAKSNAPSVCFNELRDSVFKGRNPNRKNVFGMTNTRTEVTLVPWAEVEVRLLKKVHEALARCRKVTRDNYYEGDLSKMLFLFDSDEVPYLPSAFNYTFLRRRLKTVETIKGKTPSPSIFQKLNITMPVDGRIQIAEINTHDPRRWLTTMGLEHGEKLSDVLINKWASRCKLAQLKSYDFRTPEATAALAAMPESSKLIELADISNGLASAEKLEDQFGLKLAILVAHDAGIAMTSMDAVTEAIENRPIANSSRGIIIIYPQRFGVCFHQHHEKPCRNYSNDLEASCVTCNEGSFVKGHIPTNDEIRKKATQLFSSILRHLENLARTHNRNIADDPAALSEHMVTLVEKGLDRATLELLAVHLITEFHQINALIKDRQFARRLEQAFVSRGVVGYLDDPKVASGALIKYHSPTQHADPLLEIALDAHGGREQVTLDESALIEKHPQFAHKALGLTDERHLIAPDTEDD